MEPERVERIERDLESLSGVRAARLRVDGDEIQEVHIVASPRRDAKAIVRDVVTTLFAWHGIRINYRKVSVAALGEEADRSLPESAGPRFQFHSVNTMVGGTDVDVQVDLSLGEQRLLGTATGANTPEERLRLVGEATLEAVAKATEETCRWNLAGVARVDLGGHDAVAVKVLLLRQRSRLELAGCAVVVTYPEEATVFAVLQAINRIVTRHLKPSWKEYEIGPEGEVPGGGEPPLQERGVEKGT
jgi:ABC-type transporter Mla MlaB component